MAMAEREQFSSQLDSGMLFRLREIADREEREFHEVLEDAVRGYLKYRTNDVMGPEMSAYLDVILERMGRFQKMRELREQKTE
ncbi:MAG: hypothetical protein F4X66_06840 [Chloroflexi bacterium]|nr:hypothetical protein [Chloroflexota bacterium]MYE39054.1 hypothetical protein [Chloroflexota bacterium]